MDVRELLWVIGACPELRMVAVLGDEGQVLSIYLRRQLENCGVFFVLRAENAKGRANQPWQRSNGRFWNGVLDQNLSKHVQRHQHGRPWEPLYSEVWAESVDQEP